MPQGLHRLAPPWLECRKDRLILVMDNKIQSLLPLLNSYIRCIHKKTIYPAHMLWVNRSFTEQLMCNVLLALQEGLNNYEIGWKTEYIFLLSNSFELGYS